MTALTLPDVASRINAEHEAAEHHARTAVEHAIECGRLLTEAKTAVEHGDWIPWLEEYVTVTPRTAQRYIQLAANATRVSHLTSVREALEHLAETTQSSSDPERRSPQDWPRTPSDTDTWSTPDWILDAARDVLGAIDTDPATNPTAAARVQAAQHYTKDDDGLSKPWRGRVWMNPPYSDITPWIDKLHDEMQAGRVTEAIVLLPHLRQARWMNVTLETASAYWMPRARVAFVNPESGDEISGAPIGNVAAYFGPRPGRFIEGFRGLGHVLVPAGGAA